MDGYRGRDYWTNEELRKATSAHYWVGVIAGALGVLGLEAGLAWIFNYF